MSLSAAEAANHHLTVTLPDGKHAGGRVVYLQPTFLFQLEQIGEVHILCSEWLEPYRHPAIYSTDAETFSGRFMPTNYEIADANHWLFKGLFKRTP